MGVGKATGKHRATEAATAALHSPLLDSPNSPTPHSHSSSSVASPVRGASGVIFNVVGGADLTLNEVHAAADVIYEAVGNDNQNVNIIFGAMIDENITNGEVL